MQTSLRSVIGDMGLDDTLASRQEIEKLVAGKVCKVCQDWGLTILGVDLLEIDPTPTIQVSRDLMVVVMISVLCMSRSVPNVIEEHRRLLPKVMPNRCVWKVLGRN